jgi:Family of unknown function (DUF6444)
LERYRRPELRVAELERRLGSDSTTSGTPPSKDPIGARERCKAERTRERQFSERERREDRKPGGQPGHPGAGLPRDPDPDERAEVAPPAECSRCGTGLAGAERAGTWWSQVWDVKIARVVTEYLLPLLSCSCCGKVNAARGPGQSYPGSVSYGPGINTAAVLLSCYGNVPSERAADLIGMLLGMPVSAGFVDLASERLSARLEDVDADLVIDTGGRAGRLTRPLRAPAEGGDCGIAYVSRQYQMLDGAAAGPVNMPFGVMVTYPGYLAAVFIHDNQIVSALIARASTDRQLAALRTRAAFEAAARAIPALAAWTDPGHARPVTSVLPRGRLYNSYRGQLDDAGRVAPDGLIHAGQAHLPMTACLRIGASSAIMAPCLACRSKTCPSRLMPSCVSVPPQRTSPSRNT